MLHHLGLSSSGLSLEKLLRSYHIKKVLREAGVNWNIQSVVAYVLGAAILLVCSVGYVEFVSSVGFPDGHASDYELKMSIMLHAVAIPLLLLSLYAVNLGVVGNKRNISKQLTVTAVILIALLATFFLSDVYLYNNFDHGQGG